MHAHFTIRHHTRVVRIVVGMIRRHERMVAVVRRGVRIVVEMVRDVRRRWRMSIEIRHINVDRRAETSLVILITLIRWHASILINASVMWLIKFRPMLSLESEIMIIVLQLSNALHILCLTKLIFWIQTLLVEILLLLIWLLWHPKQKLNLVIKIRRRLFGVYVPTRRFLFAHIVSRVDFWLKEVLIVIRLFINFSVCILLILLRWLLVELNVSFSLSLRTLIRSLSVFD